MPDWARKDLPKRTKSTRNTIGRTFPRAPGMDAARELLIKNFMEGGDIQTPIQNIRALLPQPAVDLRRKGAA
jgi:hypothetical protein